MALTMAPESVDPNNQLEPKLSLLLANRSVITPSRRLSSEVASQNVRSEARLRAQSSED